MDLLRVTGETILVPMAVASEIRRRGNHDVTAQAMGKAPWLILRETPAVPAFIQAWDLGEGESSVLTWAHTYPGTEAIIDDLAARRCAAALGIPVRGTLGVILAAKKRGLIPAARPILETMRQSGMYLADRIVADALRLVGE